MKGLTRNLHISPPVRILIVVFAVVLSLATIYLPFTRKQEALASRIEAARKAYREAVAMTTRYRAAEIQHSEAGVALQERLFSYLERVTRDLGLEGKIGSIRPENREDADGNLIEAVNVAFKGITLNEFVTFLYHIEVLKQEICVQAITIKKDGQDNLVTQMTLQKLNQGG